MSYETKKHLIIFILCLMLIEIVLAFNSRKGGQAVCGIELVTKGDYKFYFPEAKKLMQNPLTNKIGLMDKDGRVYKILEPGQFKGYVYCQGEPKDVSEVIHETWN